VIVLCNEEEKEMPSVIELENDKKTDISSKKSKSKIPHLKVVDGHVQIDDNDPLQKKWFEEFKK
jgi:hypothetical protein